MAGSIDNIPNNISQLVPYCMIPCYPTAADLPLRGNAYNAAVTESPVNFYIFDRIADAWALIGGAGGGGDVSVLTDNGNKTYNHLAGAVNSTIDSRPFRKAIVVSDTVNTIGNNFNVGIDDTLSILLIDTSNADITITLPDAAALTLFDLFLTLQHVAGSNDVIIRIPDSNGLNNPAKLTGFDGLAYGTALYPYPSSGGYYELPFSQMGSAVSLVADRATDEWTIHSIINKPSGHQVNIVGTASEVLVPAEWSGNTILIDLPGAGAGDQILTLPDPDLLGKAGFEISIKIAEESTNSLVIRVPDSHHISAINLSPVEGWVTAGGYHSITIPGTGGEGKGYTLAGFPYKYGEVGPAGPAAPYWLITERHGLSGSADNLGNHIATQDLDLAGNNLLNAGNVQAFESSSVALTGQALVPLLMDNPLGTFYGTLAAPATSGDLSVSAAGVPGGFAHILYQAASAPTLTGMIDQNVTANWDAVNINIIIVYQHADGSYIAKHAGVL